jgi:hypothetical protein
MVCCQLLRMASTLALDSAGRGVAARAAVAWANALAGSSTLNTSAVNV